MKTGGDMVGDVIAAFLNSATAPMVQRHHRTEGKYSLSSLMMSMWLITGVGKKPTRATLFYL